MKSIWLFVNASNTDKDFAWMQEHLKGDVTIYNISDEVGQVAIQGPKAEAILQKLTETDLSQNCCLSFRSKCEC